MPVVWPRYAGTSYTGSQSATPCQCLAISVPRSPNQSNCLWLAQCCPTAGERVDLTGRQFHQQGGQINEMANAALYTNGQFVTCSGFGLNSLSKTVTGGNFWFHPKTLYDPIVPNCHG